MFFRKSRSVEEFEIDEKFEILKNNFVNLVEGRIREIKSKKRFPIINEYKIISEIGNQLKSSNSSEFTWFLEKLKEIKDKKMFKELIKDKRERQILKTLLTQYEIGIYSDRNIPEKVLKKINELLLESEEIIYILEGGFGTHERKTGSAVKVEGTFGSGAMMGRPYLVLTNLRAIIYAKGWFTEDFRDFYYNDIVSVDFEKGLVFDSVTIHAPGSIEKFEVEKVKRDKTTVPSKY